MAAEAVVDIILKAQSRVAIKAFKANVSEEHFPARSRFQMQGLQVDAQVPRALNVAKMKAIPASQGTDGPTAGELAGEWDRLRSLRNGESASVRRF